ncbi:unnamed protein product [Mytilus edulis]|uniref:Uncharacterized protein n=1 Tax=Mytilus edulis TaxID=6550 RepID=A0A8S3VG81_MYTED|nr:unnamed protein product [Mytilus edulis]
MSKNTTTGTARRRDEVTTALGCSDNFSNKGDNIGIEHNEIRSTSRSEVDLTERSDESKHTDFDVSACKVITSDNRIQSKCSSEIVICSRSGKCVNSIIEACVNKKSYDSFEMLSDGNDIEKLDTFNREDKGGKETSDSRISCKKTQQSLSMGVENKQIKMNVSTNKSNSGVVTNYLIDKSKLCGLFLLHFYLLINLLCLLFCSLYAQMGNGSLCDKFAE